MKLQIPDCENDGANWMTWDRRDIPVHLSIINDTRRSMLQSYDCGECYIFQNSFIFLRLFPTLPTAILHAQALKIVSHPSNKYNFEE